MKGESLYKISDLMGNSPEICRRHYAHLMPESLTDCVEFTESDALPTAPVAPPRLSPPASDVQQEVRKLRLVVNNSVKESR